MDQDVVSLFRRQHGVASVAQLLEVDGVSRDRINGWARRGKVRRREHGIVMAAGAPSTPEADVVAAMLRAGPGARAIGPRMLALTGIRGFTRTDPFGVLVPAVRRLPKHVSFAAFRDPAFWDRSIVADGITVPNPARALVEMARFTHGEALQRAVDAARWERRPTTEALLACLGELPRGYVPAARVRGLVRAGGLLSDSSQERVMVAILGEEFGPIEVQVWVSSTRRVDALAREHGIVFEYQGADHRTASGRRKDRARDAELHALGFFVMHVYAEDLREPAALLARVRRVIANRS